jgi:anti-sigma factor RsiW
MTTCDRLPVEELVAWLDGETDAADSARVAAHVAACAACALEAKLLRESGEMLARLPSAAPSPGFEARVVAAARQGENEATGSRTATAPGGRLRILRPRVAVAAAAVVGVAAGAWWLSSSRDAEVLSARDEEAIAEDLAVLSNLDALTRAESDDLAQLADDLDVIDAFSGDEEGG